MQSDSDAETLTAVNTLAVKVPEFISQDPRLWFAQLELYFKGRRITRQDSKYTTAAMNLPPHVSLEVSELIYHPPSENPYDALKAAVLERLASSEEQNLRKLLSGVQIGDRTPTQLLRHMRNLTNENKVHEVLVRELWLQALPQHLRTPLSVVDKETPLNKLAELADQVHQSCSGHNVCQVQSKPVELLEELAALRQQFQQLSTQVAALTTASSSQRSYRRRSRSRPRKSSVNRREDDGVCYYHRRFGNKARRCTHPCTFQPTQTSGNASSNQ